MATSAAPKDAAEWWITQARSGFLPKANYSESWARSDNSSIILVDFIRLRMREGIALDEAVIDAGAPIIRSRLSHLS